MDQVMAVALGHPHMSPWDRIPTQAKFLWDLPLILVWEGLVRVCQGGPVQGIQAWGAQVQHTMGWGAPVLAIT